MTSYTNFADYASAQPYWLPGEMIEECYGKDAAKAGNVQRTPAGWLILDGDYRPATALEIAGIEAQMIKLAEALAHFAGSSFDEALADTLADFAQADDDDAWHAWLERWADDWADTYASARFGFTLM